MNKRVNVEEKYKVRTSGFMYLDFESVRSSRVEWLPILERQRLDCGLIKCQSEMVGVDDGRTT